LPEADRTEKATPRKRQKAREEGQVARTRELAPALALMTAVMCLSWLVVRWPREWYDLFSTVLMADLRNSEGIFAVAVRKTALLTVRWAGPPVAFGFLVALAASLAQGGLVLAPKALTLKPQKFSPGSNIQRLFSLNSIQRVLKSCVPTGILVYLAATTLVERWDQLRNLSFAPAKVSFLWVLALMFEMLWKGGLVFAIWSAADFFLQRFNFERQLRMSKQEIKEESKETEGNPAIRGRIRRLQRQMRKRRMIREASQATVVVTNPTHFAVALRYLPEEMEAPVVVAKGLNLLAQMIRQQAVWHGVPIVENPPLAQALYRTVEVGETIPAKLYTAVAEILAFIYRMQAKERRTQLVAGNPTYAQV
jgi:flagellar biosynthetic protein FlhB